jgi:malic enzyme
MQVMHRLKPTILISCTSSQVAMEPIPESAIRTMSKHCRRPIIFALSSPTAEVSAAQAYHWSGGKAMYANFEGQQEEVTTPHGQVLTPSKVQSVYIFPGLALGTCVVRATRIKEEQIVAAAKAVAAMVSDEDRELGRVLPPASQLHAVAKQVAVVTAKTAYEYGVATALPKPADLTAMIETHVHDPSYERFG